MDDGKANVMSLSMLNTLHAAFDAAERDKTVPILSARGRHFSGGFDLNVFKSGSAEQQYLMVRAGAELALRILSFPTPVVVACHGNDFPMGPIFDHVGGSPHRGRARLSHRHERSCDRVDGPPICRRDRAAAADAGLFQPGGDDLGNGGPAEALTAGFFDRVVPADELEGATQAAAQALSTLNMAAYAATKARARGAVIAMIRTMIDEDITPQYGDDRVARRA
jgi:enoyl-CoA hydratase